MVNNDIKNYFDFLFYIGVTSDETSDKIFQLISSKYNDISNQEKHIDNLLASLTCDYLKSLDKKQLELIGKNIYEQYLINKLKSELKMVKKLLIIRHNFFRRKKKKYFNIWRLLTINSDIYSFSLINKNPSYVSMKTKSSSSKKNIFNSKHFLDKLDFYSDKKKENNDKIKLMMESNITNECTFKPVLNSSFKRNNSKKNINGHETNIKKYENDNMKSYKIYNYDDRYNNYCCKSNRNKINENKIKKKIFSPKISNNINNNINKRNDYLYKNQKTSDIRYNKIFKI